MRKVYLDYNAATPVMPEVLEAMLPYFTQKYGNPASLHSFGREVADAMEKAACEVASFIEAGKDEIIFTGSGAESNNLAIAGTAYKQRQNGKTRIISSKIEHSSTYQACRRLKKEGFDLTYLDADRNGLIDINALDQAIDGKTALVSLLLVNNETGTVLDHENIRKAIEKHNVPLHYDAVQAAGKMPLDVDKLGVSLLSLSAHKIYGPKGTGALYRRSGYEIEQILSGDGQEKGLRPGTHNVTGIVGMGAACRIMQSRLGSYIRHCRMMRDRLEDGILEGYPAVKINGSREYRVCNTVNMSFPGYSGKNLAEELDRRGIAVSTGAACSAESNEASRVLEAMGLSEVELFGALRFAVGDATCEADIDYVTEQLLDILREKDKAIGGSEIINL